VVGGWTSEAPAAAERERIERSLGGLSHARTDGEEADEFDPANEVDLYQDE